MIKCISKNPYLTNPYLFTRKTIGKQSQNHFSDPQAKPVIHQANLNPRKNIQKTKKTQSPASTLYKCPYLHRPLYKTPGITGEAPEAPKFHKSENKEKHPQKKQRYTKEFRHHSHLSCENLEFPDNS